MTSLDGRCQELLGSLRPSLASPHSTAAPTYLAACFESNGDKERRRQGAAPRRSGAEKERRNLHSVGSTYAGYRDSAAIDAHNGPSGT